MLLCCAMWVKICLSGYPTVMDFQLLMVSYGLAGRTLTRRLGQGIALGLTTIALFAVMSMALLWCTWMWRFSGNANFFYFQTIVWNAAHVLLFINLLTV